MSFLRRFFSVPLCDQPDAPADATAPQLPASAAGSFFTRTDWAAFWTGTLTSFLVYFFTCAPSVTLEDSPSSLLNQRATAHVGRLRQPS